MLINGSVLVDGDTIRFFTRYELSEFMAYYHVETDAHEAILAEGAATERFVDVIVLKNYANYSEYMEVFGMARTALWS